MTDDQVMREFAIAIRKADKRFEHDRVSGTRVYADYLRAEMRERGLRLVLLGTPEPESKPENSK